MKVFDTSTTGELFRSKTPSKRVNNSGDPVGVQKRLPKEAATPAVKAGGVAKSLETELRASSELRGMSSGVGDQVNASNKLNIQSLSRNKIKYGLDDDKKVVMQLVDPESNEIIRQIPPEEQARIAKAIEKILEESATKDKSREDVSIDTVI